MKVERAKLTWFERLYIPSILNGFKVTLRHFFSWKRSKVYAESGADDKFTRDFIAAWNKVMMADRFDVK